MKHKCNGKCARCEEIKLDIQIKTLPREIQVAIKRAFRAAKCEDLYDGNAIAYIDVIGQELAREKELRAKYERWITQMMNDAQNQFRVFGYVEERYKD